MVQVLSNVKNKISQKNKNSMYNTYINMSKKKKKKMLAYKLRKKLNYNQIHHVGKQY